MRWKRGSLPKAVVALGLMFATLFPAAPAPAAEQFEPGDVFVAVGNSKVQWRRPDGSLVKVLTTANPSLYTTGMAFDAQGNLLVTEFTANSISKFDRSGNLVAVYAPGLRRPESMVIDSAGNMYIGQYRSGSVTKLDPAGRLIAQIPSGYHRTDSVELDADQCTLYFNGDGMEIKRVNACTGEVLAPFATLPDAGYLMRILPGGSMLVADKSAVLQLSSSGQVVKTYDAPGQDCFFAVNLDPDGKSFWSADWCTSEVVRFDIASGEKLSSFNTGTAFYTVFGLAIYGESTAAKPTDTVAPTTTAAVTPAPNGAGWQNTPVIAAFMAEDAAPAGVAPSGVRAITVDGAPAPCPPGQACSFTVGTDGIHEFSYFATDNAGNAESPRTLTVKLDQTAPEITYSGNAGNYLADQLISITCTAADALSGVTVTTCAELKAPAWSYAPGTHTLTATATDAAGNAGTGSASFTVTVTPGSTCNVVKQFVSSKGLAQSLCAKLEGGAGPLAAFGHEVRAQTGKALTEEQAAILMRLAQSL